MRPTLNPSMGGLETRHLGSIGARRRARSQILRLVTGDAGERRLSTACCRTSILLPTMSSRPTLSTKRSGPFVHGEQDPDGMTRPWPPKHPTDQVGCHRPARRSHRWVTCHLRHHVVAGVGDRPPNVDHHLSVRRRERDPRDPGLDAMGLGPRTQPVSLQCALCRSGWGQHVDQHIMDRRARCSSLRSHGSSARLPHSTLS